MKTKTIILITAILISLCVRAQENETPAQWNLTQCIDYALKQNIQVRQSILTNLANQVNKEQAEAQKLPSLSASARQNFSWGNREDASTGKSVFSGNNSTSYSLSSGITLYNGSKLNNLIKQADLDWQSGIYDSETIKETISLSILNAFLQVLFTEEQIKNAESQLESTTEQLNYAKERLAAGIISQSDYLQVKSQVATEKGNLTSAQSQNAIAKVNLMQLMELPVTENFHLEKPDLGESVNQSIYPLAADVYAAALQIKPQIKSVGYKKESAALNEKIAQAGYYPTISAEAGVGTSYSNLYETGYFSQLNDQFSPSLGLSLSIPIFQKKQVKSNVALAKINYQNAELQEIDTQNQLRKEIEQVCQDVISVQAEYEANLEQYKATQESYALAEEKYNNGLINSVDFLFEKTNLIVSESQLLQSKYNLIFNYKILDFYLGNPISL
ncbi:outer membrane protein [Mariniphaga anaerophila]|uniref:Outer membrane protein n=1 Tax=Mariniphaga anaerophila TaxID=1484053 RepID=A0A1M4TLG2_9BACT|nr:TolC family protein [Mariniphaga anaerophila]SHE45323.1 outer membrane protein [Mariniphaga anaerophila]